MAETAGILNSQAAVIQVGAATISCLTDASLSITQETRDTTCKDSGGWSNVLGAKRTWEMSGSFLFAYDATYGFDDLFALILSQATATIAWGSVVVGDKIWSGSGLLTSLSASSSGTDENVTADFTFMGVGALAQTTNA